ncbi:MAG: glycosyltransferase WbuB [Cyclobacteriaceae bacterium]|nr:MAG: glycosyltransferase WbuB [Cyclobacteriaceae bacterium]
MKILLLHQFFNTPHGGGALRSYFLATALCRSGFAVHVITTHNKPHYHREETEGVDVHYLPVPYQNHYGFFRRVYSFLLFVLSIIRHASRFRQAGLCYAISAPLTTGLAAMVLKWRYGMPYVFEVGDLWPEAPIQLGMVRNTLLKKMLYALEAAIYRQARSIVALSVPIAENIRQRFPAYTVEVLPNMADIGYFGVAAEPETKAKFNATGKLVVSYFGTMGRANGLQFVLNCAQACGKEKLPVLFLLCGDGAERSSLERTTHEMQLNNVVFMPFQNREGIRRLMGITDVALVCFRPLPVLETGSPNKYFDALAAGKAVVVNFGGWIRAEIEQSGCGFYAANATDFARKIAAYLQNENLLKQAQHAALQTAQRYARTVLSARFVTLVKRASEKA